MSTVRLRPLQGNWGFSIPGDSEVELISAQGSAVVRADQVPVGRLVRHLGMPHRVVAIAADDGVVRRLTHRTPERTA